ncbi:MAG: serine/threonine protein kinase [Planctomycetes bacterium]|nr:serine/threonine protein kinase [Planctomycetota bacterium]
MSSSAAKPGVDRADADADAEAAPDPSRIPGDESAEANAAEATRGTARSDLGTLGGVRLLSIIGRGGMGEVYLGRHLTMNVDVAVKVIKGGLELSKRFQREAELSARVIHENVVRIYNAGIEGDRLYLVQEFIDGPNLKQLLRDGGAMPWRRALELTRQIARGLSAAHRAAIVHRDVKPSNVMVAADGTAKITDLGLARHLVDEPDETQTGAVLGTPTYMAPEQAKDSRKVSPRSDVYALGVTLFQLLTGVTPFQKVGHTSMLLAHIHDPVPDIRALVDGLPDAIARLVERMLAKDPARRPADGQAVVDELDAICAPGAALGVGRRSHRRWRTIVVGGAVMTIALAAMTVLAVRERSADAPRTAAMDAREQALPASKARESAIPNATIPPAQPAIPPVPAIDTWQSPPRAVFLLADRLPPEQMVAISKAMRVSGLPVVEREKIDALTAEQDLSTDHRIDTATMGRLGRLVGGHIAVFAASVSDHLEVRTVVVESGELADFQIVAPSDIATTVPAMIAAAANLLPAQGYATSAGDEADATLGSVHGLRVGDRLQIWSGTAADRGTRLAVAQVTAVSRSSSTIRTDAVARQRRLVTKIEQ